MLIMVGRKYVLDASLALGSKADAHNFYANSGKKVLRKAKKEFADSEVSLVECAHAPRGRAVVNKRGRPAKASKAAKSEKKGKRGRPKGSKNKPKETKVETPVVESATVEHNPEVAQTA